MEEYQKRLVNEYNELNERIIRLGDFINNNPKYYELVADEQTDLYQQYQYMRMYKNCLKSRCDRQKIDLN